MTPSCFAVRVSSTVVNRALVLSDSFGINDHEMIPVTAGLPGRHRHPVAANSRPTGGTGGYSHCGPSTFDLAAGCDTPRCGGLVTSPAENHWPAQRLVTNPGRNSYARSCGRASLSAAVTTVFLLRARSSMSSGPAPVSMKASWGTLNHQAASAMVMKTR